MSVSFAEYTATKSAKMSIQWTIVCGILFAEIGVVAALLCPFIHPSRWNRLLKSRFVESLKVKAYVLFGVQFVTLVIFFCDSVREMRKYSVKMSGISEHLHVADEEHASMRLFRAQRNFYISGFALFFMWVIRRLITMIAAHAVVMAESVAILRQAESASSQARTLLNLQSNGAPSELLKEKKEKERHQLKSSSLEEEFDKLMKEHAKLQQTVEKSEEKKDA
ncbi:hypothetical protein J437_LFUL009272 [Ladona fulva]|uniref:Endoplasmic reticulum transmembrane protein n=1 Tax=Ladona fulva TaxID=123851 RepID=A0A8K0NZJ5_LADFU|nr:hypothetical protein J437_LFUL009272 [Ladona fulva]